MTKQTPDDARDVTEAIRSGAYFQQARNWYFILFSNPAVERSFFFVTFAIAALTFLIAVFALIAILPLKENYPFVMRNDRMAEASPRLVKLRHGRHESADEAMMRFFAGSYVSMREGYSRDKAQKHEQFVANYSDPATLQAYLQAMDVSNPASPKLLFRDARMQRVAEPVSVRMNLLVQPYQALVDFSVLVLGGQAVRPVSYTADIRFSYSPLQAAEELDSVTGETVTRFTQPKFQVVSYHVQPSAAK